MPSSVRSSRGRLLRQCSFAAFMVLYGAALIAGIAIALVLVRPRVERLLCS
jgi:hypothetical protein